MYTWSDKDFEGAVVNRTFPSLYGCSLRIYVYSPFKYIWIYAYSPFKYIWIYAYSPFKAQTAHQWLPYLGSVFKKDTLIKTFLKYE